MKRCALLVGLILFVSLPARAQSDYPKVELFAGYAYASTDIRFNILDQGTHGWAGSAGVNLHRYFGVIADISGHYGDTRLQNLAFVCILVFPPPPECAQKVNFSTSQYLFGPRLTLRRRRLSWFAHALAGVVQLRTSSFTLPGFTFDGVTVSAITVPARSGTYFAMGFGTGLDVSAAKRFALRLLQLDYVPIRGAGSLWLDNLRLRFGIVVKLGGGS